MVLGRDRKDRSDFFAVNALTVAHGRVAIITGRIAQRIALPCWTLRTPQSHGCKAKAVILGGDEVRCFVYSGVGGAESTSPGYRCERCDHELAALTNKDQEPPQVQEFLLEHQAGNESAGTTENDLAESLLRRKRART